ncbi:MAG: hypothetical protein ACPLPX_08690 [Candidatus Kapaibacteriota bacterium]
MKICRSLSVFFMLLLIPICAFSDKRSYVWTYEYLIMEPGKAEIEHYLTLSAPKFNEIKGKASVEHKLEVEVGMTKHFDFSIYQKFVQQPEQNLQYTGFDLRARFLIGEKNQFPLDPLIYIEYGSDATLSSHKFETKLILAKDIGRLNIAFNPIIEIEYEDEAEFAFEYAFGTRYLISELFGAGLELKGDKKAHYIGIVLSHGKENLWVAASPTFMFSKNLNNKPEFLFRMILGLGL